MFYTWFQVLDVHNVKAHIHQHLPQKAPYMCIEDSRLQWFEDSFLVYLKDWKASCQNPTAFLSSSTYRAIRITTISTISCIKFLLESGANFVLTHKFYSDDIEGLSGSF